jgi:hypothetical protein
VPVGEGRGGGEAPRAGKGGGGKGGGEGGGRAVVGETGQAEANVGDEVDEGDDEVPDYAMVAGVDGVEGKP